MLVSFIIPAYNAADTIVRCLDSLYNLTLDKEDYEIFVIDDASTDDTVSVIENWKGSFRKDKKLENGDCKLEILRQPENRRQGAARNKGVSVAKGEYICFVDADDAVTDGIEAAIRLAKEKDTDMVALHYGSADAQGSMTSEAEHLSFKDNQLFTGIEMQNKHPYWSSGPVPYVYSRAFLEQVNYPFVEGVLFEDADFVAVHLYHAMRMCYSPVLGYKLFYREGSTTRSVGYKNIADYLLLGVRMMRFYEQIMSEIEHDLTHDRVKFAEVILEGACWNVQKSCKRMIKLESMNAVRAYYDRINEYINLNDIYHDARFRKYYWSVWTLLCIGHRKIATIILSIVIPVYKLVKR